MYTPEELIGRKFRGMFQRRKDLIEKFEQTRARLFDQPDRRKEFDAIWKVGENGVAECNEKYEFDLEMSEQDFTPAAMRRKGRR